MKTFGFLSLFFLLNSTLGWASNVPAISCSSRDPEASLSLSITIDSSGNVTYTRPKLKPGQTEFPVGSDRPLYFNAEKYEDMGNSISNYSGQPEFILSVDHKVWDYVTKDVQGYDSKFIYLNSKNEQTTAFVLCRYLQN